MATAEDNEEKHDQISELEKAFQDCITVLTSQEYFSPNESEETKLSVENTIQRFLDAARQTEAFFLSKRLQLSVQKPEQVLKEDIQELKFELERKEKLIEKHHEHLQSWINLLHRPKAPTTSTPTTSAQTSGATAQTFPLQGQTQGYSGPPQQPASSMHQGPQPGQYPGPPLPGSQGYSMPPPHQPPPSYPQNPLAYLEQNLSNIGMPERR